KRRGYQEPSEVQWVQCDTCKKWRRLPDFVDLDKLPAKWHCEMNSYDLARANCRAKEEEELKVRQQKRQQQQQRQQDDEDNDDDDDEESDEESQAKDVNLRRFLKGWARRIRCAEKAKSKLAPSMSTRGKRKAPSQAQWVRCQNCGKWRALLRCMDPSVFLGHGQQFYCLMNTWQESLASCSAPQENQYDVEVLFPTPEPPPSETEQQDHRPEEEENQQQHDGMGDGDNNGVRSRGGSEDGKGFGMHDSNEHDGYGYDHQYPPEYSNNGYDGPR
ncbi:unnamed protein product, partial [Scytosiphon promiscuus]